SSEQARLLELIEVQNQEGPCLDCYHTGASIVEESIETSDRWPRFRVEALAADFRSVQAEPLRLRDEVIGALNLFRVHAGRLSEVEREICRGLASVATIGLLQERAVREG